MNSLPHLCLFIQKGNFKGHWISLEEKGWGMCNVRDGGGYRGLQNSSSWWWDHELEAWGQQVRPSAGSTTSGFLPGVFTGEKNVSCALETQKSDLQDRCKQITDAWELRCQEMVNKSLEGHGTCAQVLTLRKGRRVKNLQSVINTRLGEIRGGHQTEEHWPRRKQTRWGWHWCLGIAVLELSLSKLGWCLLLGLGHILLLVGVMRWTYRADSSLKDFSVLLVLIQGKTK